MKKVILALAIVLAFIFTGCSNDIKPTKVDIDQSKLYKTGISADLYHYVIVSDSGRDMSARSETIRRVIEHTNNLLLNGGYKTYDSLADKILTEDPKLKKNLAKLIDRRFISINETIDEDKYRVTISLAKTSCSCE